MGWTEKAIDYTERVAAIEDRIAQEMVAVVRLAKVPVSLERKLAPLRILRAGLIAKAIRADRISARPTHVAAEKARAKGRAA